MLKFESKKDDDLFGDGGGYGSGHPWYYLLGGRILSVDEIEPLETTWEMHNPESPSFQKNVSEMIKKVEADLENDIRKYLEIIEKGEKAFSEYDYNIAYQGDVEGMVAGGLALKRNHICYNKGLLKFLREHNYGERQTSLF